MFEPPRLRPLDMSKSTKREHPDIKAGRATQYLCLIGDRYFCGSFSRQWYGLNFDNWIPGTVGLQFDAPGTNSSDWQMIWEIVQ